MKNKKDLASDPRLNIIQYQQPHSPLQEATVQRTVQLYLFWIFERTKEGGGDPHLLVTLPPRWILTPTKETKGKKSQ